MYKIFLVIDLENAYNTISKFNTAVPKIKGILAPLAKRSGISLESALLMIAVSDFNELICFLSNSAKTELIANGLAEYNEERIALTGKGKILAKSFIAVVEKLNY